MGPVASTGKAIVHWIGCVNAIKILSKKQKNVYEKVITSNLCKGMERKAPIKIFTNKSKKQKNVLPWQHLLPGIIEKLISSNPCRGLECKEPRERLLSRRNIKSVAMATLVARCYRKTNQLQCAQGYGKQRTHKVFISPRNRKNCCHGNTCCQLLLKN